jgi:hypothetical protein
MVIKYYTFIHKHGPSEISEEGVVVHSVFVTNSEHNFLSLLHPSDPCSSTSTHSFKEQFHLHDFENDSDLHVYFPKFLQ